VRSGRKKKNWNPHTRDVFKKKKIRKCLNGRRESKTRETFQVLSGIGTNGPVECVREEGVPNSDY